MKNPQLFTDEGWNEDRMDVIGQNGNSGIHYALLDEEGTPVRFFDYQAEGTVKWPPDPAQLDPDDPEWDNPPF